MTTARSRTVVVEEEGVYHCISRCVRRAYLCGVDPLTGKNYNHRKQWIKSRLEELQSIFAIDVLAYAIMCTHSHTMLRNNPSEVIAWSPDEVATRWLRLFPKRRDKKGRPAVPSREELDFISLNKKRLEEYRWRLCDISWFMRCLNEAIARASNAEDGVKGRFWDGRFKAKRVYDEAAITSCMIYVDLNEIRAKIAKVPEESKHTSAYERIKKRHSRKKLWLAPIERTESNNGILSLSLTDYLKLLDETGRAVVEGKRGSIPKDIAPILQRLSIRSESWMVAALDFDRLFYRVIGTSNSMKEAATRMGQSWLKGVGASRLLFVD